MKHGHVIGRQLPHFYRPHDLHHAFLVCPFIQCLKYLTILALAQLLGDEEAVERRTLAQRRLR